MPDVLVLALLLCFFASKADSHPIVKMLAASPPQPGAMGLNAKDFGAIGDGVADDSLALQAAMDAAFERSLPLLVPAGHYRINVTLNINTTSRPGQADRPGLRLLGQGAGLTSIFAGAPMLAVLNYSCVGSPKFGVAAPISTEDQYVGDIRIDAAGLANYSILAPGMSRSRFSRVSITGARNVGLSIGYGWCNYIEGCRFGGNGVGLHTYNSANNIDVIDSIFEGNTGLGIYISGGMQINIEGNVLEGNGGPGIIIFGAKGVQIASNYFEKNCQRATPGGRYNDTRFKHMVPEAIGQAFDPVIEFNTDIVLTGCSSSFDHNSDYRHWKPIEFCYGAAYKPSSVTISGGYHSPTSNGSATLIIAGEGIVLQANNGRGSNISLVETCSDSSLCQVSKLFMRANTGFSAVSQHDPTILMNHGLIRLRPTAKPFSGGLGTHTWANEDSEPLFRPRNLLQGVSPSAWVASGGCSVAPAEDGEQFNGQDVWNVWNVTNQCHLTILQLELTKALEVRGQQVYLAIQLNVTLAKTGVSLLIDGAGSSDSDDPGGWRLKTFQRPLGVTGVATFGLKLMSSNPIAAHSVALQLAGTVLAPIGHEWSRL